MKPALRKDQFTALFPKEPAFRWKQIERALFQPNVNSWTDVTTLSKPMREVLAEQMPLMSITADRIYRSTRDDTYKAVLQTSDGLKFETVLMENKRGQWTICVSSQIGCAMRCTFCATGAMGLKRSMTADEIMDQYRFWTTFLRDRPQLKSSRISNVVFMGMGEPLANYDNVKECIHAWLRNTDLGPTRITVSSVGVLMFLEKVLTDKDWPHVRMAISLHSANQKKREEIVPTTSPDFLKKLADWSRRYAQSLGNRRHYITYEYTLISGVNDSEQLARELGKYILTTGASIINLIPYNPVPGKAFHRSAQEGIDKFKAVILSFGIDVTQRKTMGDDIAAACGQLIVDDSAETEQLKKLRIPLSVG